MCCIGRPPGIVFRAGFLGADATDRDSGPGRLEEDILLDPGCTSLDAGLEGVVPGPPVRCIDLEAPGRPPVLILVPPSCCLLYILLKE